jgi:hypothetical protein
VRGLFLGSASVINVADGTTTYSYICPTSSSSSADTDEDPDDWNACDDGYAKEATFVDGPSQYAYYVTTNWNTQSYTMFDDNGNGTTISTDVETDSLTHTASLTISFVCSLSGSVIKTDCVATFTAPALNSAESSEIDSMNYAQTATFDDPFGATVTSSSWDQSEWMTLGPVPVVSGAEKLSGGAKATGTGTQPKGNGAEKMAVGSSFGLVLAIFAGLLFV